MSDYKDVTISQSRYDELRQDERSLADLEADQRWEETSPVRWDDEPPEVTHFLGPRLSGVYLVRLADGDVRIAEFEIRNGGDYFMSYPGVFRHTITKTPFEAVTHWRHCPKLPVVREKVEA